MTATSAVCTSGKSTKTDSSPWTKSRWSSWLQSDAIVPVGTPTEGVGLECAQHHACEREIHTACANWAFVLVTAAVCIFCGRPSFGSRKGRRQPEPTFTAALVFSRMHGDTQTVAQDQGPSRPVRANTRSLCDAVRKSDNPARNQTSLGFSLPDVGNSDQVGSGEIRFRRDGRCVAQVLAGIGETGFSGFGPRSRCRKGKAPPMCRERGEQLR